MQNSTNDELFPRFDDKLDATRIISGLYFG